MATVGARARTVGRRHRTCRFYWGIARCVPSRAHREGAKPWTQEGERTVAIIVGPGHAASLGGIGPHVGGQVGVGVLHALIHNAHVHLGK